MTRSDEHVTIDRLERRLERERTARLQAEEIAERATMHALHDPLTGLANRNLFLDRLDEALARSRRTGRSLAVFFLDLDRFKLINDSLGHHAGDRLLAEVAARLRGAVRPHDMVARMGGDEFTILCEDDVPVEWLARRLAAAIEEPVLVGDTRVYASASIGVVTADADHDSADDVVRDADAAMYRAKERGKARVEMFDVEMRGRAAERIQLEAQLHRALDRGEIEPFYQPVGDASTCAVVGFEALARWRHPDRGIVFPAEFIPVCEEVGLTLPLGRQILQLACADVRRLGKALGAERPPYVSVNLSAAQFSQSDVVSSVSEALDVSGMDPASLGLEITDHVLMSDSNASVENLRALADLGVRLALDDFGTGYSSLAHLQQLPIHVLKIDRSFTAGLGSDRANTAIVGAVVGLARALDLHTVVEGVETQAQLESVREIGSDHAQGYLFGRPQPVGQVARMLGLRSAA